MSLDATAQATPAPLAAAPATGGEAAGARRFLELAFTLAVSEFKLRYFGSALGYLWSLLRPLMLFAVLYFVFTRVVRLGADVPHYPVYLLMAVVFFTYFSETTGGAVGSLVGQASLIRKVRFPLAVIPASIALSAAFNLVLNLVVVFGFVLATGVAPRLTWLELPLILAMLAVSVMGISMILAALYVRYRDVGQIWSVLTQVIFYASPIIYTIEFLPERLDRVLMVANPLVPVIQQGRHAILDPDAPAIGGVMGGFPELLAPFVTITGLFLLGLWLFRREAPSVAENV